MLTDSACKVVFIATCIGRVNLAKHIDVLQDEQSKNERRLQIVCLDRPQLSKGPPLPHYHDFLKTSAINGTQESLEEAQRRVYPSDVVNLQFTSGKVSHP